MNFVEKIRVMTADAPIRHRSVTFVVQDADGEWVFANSVSGKREILADTTGPLYAIWTGQWTSDFFALDRAVAAAAVG